MKEQFIKWMPVMVLACFVAAVFMITDGHFWNGIVFIGAGESLSSVEAICKKKTLFLTEPKEMRNLSVKS